MLKIVLCIEKLTTSKMTFKEGEAYIGNAVNDDYWVIESVGVRTEDFDMHFEVQEEIEKESGSTTDVANKRFIEEEEMFKEILKSFGYDDIEELNDNTLEEKETLLDKLRDYIFA